jgi:hypothetical protein
VAQTFQWIETFKASVSFGNSFSKSYSTSTSSTA